jgi:hypothetical protein
MFLNFSYKLKAYTIVHAHPLFKFTRVLLASHVAPTPTSAVTLGGAVHSRIPSHHGPMRGRQLHFSGHMPRIMGSSAAISLSPQHPPSKYIILRRPDLRLSQRSENSRRRRQALACCQSRPRSARRKRAASRLSMTVWSVRCARLPTAVVRHLSSQGLKFPALSPYLLTRSLSP